MSVFQCWGASLYIPPSLFWKADDSGTWGQAKLELKCWVGLVERTSPNGFFIVPGSTKIKYILFRPSCAARLSRRTTPPSWFSSLRNVLTRSQRRKNWRTVFYMAIKHSQINPGKPNTAKLPCKAMECGGLTSSMNQLINVFGRLGSQHVSSLGCVDLKPR